eukprot:TRINITY_DN6715_c0_g1_i11.p1 TRINITY_DN6715_c0_g1~~TRINITY_DN6715_c0_g1_i11.p1  ORF type:complete len:371 (+),score=2.49 TRINITY_DN6715_c0_g1_i11:683-1795(+)
MQQQNSCPKLAQFAFIAQLIQTREFDNKLNVNPKDLICLTKQPYTIPKVFLQKKVALSWNLKNLQSVNPKPNNGILLEVDREDPLYSKNAEGKCSDRLHFFKNHFKIILKKFKWIEFNSFLKTSIVYNLSDQYLLKPRLMSDFKYPDIKYQETPKCYSFFQFMRFIIQNHWFNNVLNKWKRSKMSFQRFLQNQKRFPLQKQLLCKKLTTLSLTIEFPLNYFLDTCHIPKEPGFSFSQRFQKKFFSSFFLPSELLLKFVEKKEFTSPFQWYPQNSNGQISNQKIKEIKELKTSSSFVTGNVNDNTIQKQNSFQNDLYSVHILNMCEFIQQLLLKSQKRTLTFQRRITLLFLNFLDSLVVFSFKNLLRIKVF